MTRELEQAARPGDPAGVYHRLSARRARLATVRRAQKGFLGVAVMGATVAGFVVLAQLFGPGPGRPAVSPYGSVGAIVGCSDERGGQLCRIDGAALARGATSEDLVYLTDFTGEVVLEPAVSADGATVVFVRHAPADNTTALWTIGTDGRGMRLLDDQHDLRTPSWSPDGVIVAVADDGAPDGAGPAMLAILDPDRVPNPLVRTIELPGLVFPSTPRFSPEGTRILFVAGNRPISTGSDVYTIRVDGSDLTNRTNTTGAEWTADWSPDGERIVFGFASGSGEELFVCPVDCDDPHRLEDPSGDPIYGGLPRWSPAGGWIAFEVVEDDQDSAIHIARLDGSEVRVLARPASGLAWVPVVAANSPEPSPRPPEPEGRDVGIGFNLCRIERLGGIDWFGDGTAGISWTGTRVGDNGRCGNESVGSILAADLDGDATADVWTTVDACTACEPWAATDLDGNGTEELVVLLFADIEPIYSFFFAVPEGRPRASGINPIFLESGEAIEAGLAPEQIVRVQAGSGEEGISASAIRCEGYPDDPLLVVARWVKDERTGDVEYHGAKMRLVTSDDLLHAHFEIVETFTPTATSEDFGGDGDACGVDFNPWN